MQITFKKSHILNLIILVEALVLALSVAICIFANLNLSPLLQIPELKNPLTSIASGLGVGLIMSSVSIGLTKFSLAAKNPNSLLKNYSEMVKDLMAPLFASFHLWEIILVAIASGFCEEVFYRGVLQSTLGIVVASVIFGLCHFAGRKYFFYVIWATSAGLIFGYLLILTESLWPPIIAHMTNNFVSICYLRYKLSAGTQESDSKIENK